MKPKCSVYMGSSLDGFIARKDGGIDWLDFDLPDESGNNERGTEDSGANSGACTHKARWRHMSWGFVILMAWARVVWSRRWMCFCVVKKAAWSGLLLMWKKSQPPCPCALRSAKVAARARLRYRGKSVQNTETQE